MDHLFSLVLTVGVLYLNAFFSVAIASKAAHHIALKSFMDYKRASRFPACCYQGSFLCWCMNNITQAFIFFYFFFGVVLFLHNLKYQALAVHAF